MRLVIGGVDEISGQEPLADQPALHVDGAGEHGVDVARRDILLELVEGEISGHSWRTPDEIDGIAG